ncbi:P-loop containing nucleoside triphosphate hydrolase protein [Emericellopsis atlantica]|uniref:RNA helicase n=1 Tax=Emericellopsis atlantica TaxID=2614577 RepID=A0A9P8CLY0_9HYPO|nr:P-loop containing nucleoside triphosphate hydrolase protein [Emericellopsis atlantica]KAG9250096.1 P-loop containing nucleoside triphosphate hydrolase protein [Emericellopsis atlantica]
MDGSAHVSAAEACVYKWCEEYGDVGPRDQSLEHDLFGPEENRGLDGIDYTKVSEVAVIQEGPTQIKPVAKFADAGLHPAMLENIAMAGYKDPTPIQQYAIPAIVLNNDVIGIAQTGSGKTAAYMIPILSKLMGKAKKWAGVRPDPGSQMAVTAEPLVLIIVPTRELAIQIFNEARKFCYRSMLRPAVVYGGGHMNAQRELLSRGCDVLIGTPGRLKDFVVRADRTLSLHRLKYVVIDEADEMLHDDWHDELSPILNAQQQLGAMRYVMFSATFPKAARDLAKEYLAEDHVRFRVGRAGSTTANIRQRIIEVPKEEKHDNLVALLDAITGVRTIIFCNSHFSVDHVEDYLFHRGYPVVSITSQRSQLDREFAMRRFRSGNAPILVATGVAARGIDVHNELPSMDYGGIEEYTHRIGRTGRIGRNGLATSFFGDRDEPMADVLARTLLEAGQEIPDFLQDYLPAGMTKETVKFETESDFDETEAQAGDEADGGAGGAGGGAWGGDTNINDAGGDVWGTTSSAPVEQQPQATAAW